MVQLHPNVELISGAVSSVFMDCEQAIHEDGVSVRFDITTHECGLMVSSAEHLGEPVLEYALYFCDPTTGDPLDFGSLTYVDLLIAKTEMERCIQYGALRLGTSQDGVIMLALYRCDVFSATDLRLAGAAQESRFSETLKHLCTEFGMLAPAVQSLLDTGASETFQKVVGSLGQVCARA